MVGLMTVVVLISNLVLFDFLFYFFFFGLNFVLDPKCKYEDLISY